MKGEKKIKLLKQIDLITQQNHIWKHNDNKVIQVVIDLAKIIECQTVKEYNYTLANERARVLEDENGIEEKRENVSKTEKSTLRKKVANSAVCCTGCFESFNKFCSEYVNDYLFVRDIYFKGMEIALKLKNTVSLCAALKIHKHEWKVLTNSGLRKEWYDVMTRQVIGRYMFEKCTFSLLFLLMSDINAKKYVMTSITNQYTTKNLFLHTTEEEWLFIVKFYKNKLYTKTERSTSEIDILSFIFTYLTIEGTFANDSISKHLVTHYNSCNTEFTKYFIFKIAYLVNKKMSKNSNTLKNIFRSTLESNYLLNIEDDVGTGVRENFLFKQQSIFYLIDAFPMFSFYGCAKEFYTATENLKNELVLRELFLAIISLASSCINHDSYLPNYRYFEDMMFSYAVDPLFKSRQTKFVQKSAKTLIDTLFDDKKQYDSIKYFITLKWNMVISKLNETFNRQYYYDELFVLAEFCFFDLHKHFATIDKKLADVSRSLINNLIRLFIKIDEKSVCEKYRIFFLVITKKYRRCDFCLINASVIDKILLFYTKYAYLPTCAIELLRFLLSYPFDKSIFKGLIRMLVIEPIQTLVFDICTNMIQRVDVNLGNSFLKYCTKKLRSFNTEKSNVLLGLIFNLINDQEKNKVSMRKRPYKHAYSISNSSDTSSEYQKTSNGSTYSLSRSTSKTQEMSSSHNTSLLDSQSTETDGDTELVDSDSLPIQSEKSKEKPNGNFDFNSVIDKDTEMHKSESTSTAEKYGNETDSKSGFSEDKNNTNEINTSNDDTLEIETSTEDEQVISNADSPNLPEHDIGENYLNLHEREETPSPVDTDSRIMKELQNNIEISKTRLVDDSSDEDNNSTGDGIESDITEINLDRKKPFVTLQDEVSRTFPLDFVMEMDTELPVRLNCLNTDSSYYSKNIEDQNTLIDASCKSEKSENSNCMPIQKKYKRFEKPVQSPNSKSINHKNGDYVLPNYPLSMTSNQTACKIKNQIGTKEPTALNAGVSINSSFNPYSYTKNNMLPPRQGNLPKKSFTARDDIYSIILTSKKTLSTLEAKKIKFRDFESYSKYFTPLIINEILANIEKGKTEIDRNVVGSFRFSYCDKGPTIDEVYLNFNRCNISENDAILVVNPKDKNYVENICIVKTINHFSKIMKILINKECNNFHKHGEYYYFYITSLNTHLREYFAIEALKTYPHITDIISPQLNKEIARDEVLEAEIESTLGINKYQAGAVVHCIKTDDRIVLIQGPPGTGKTTIITSLISSFFSGRFEFERLDGKPRILICAPSNTAIDEVARRILKNGILLFNETNFSPNLLRVGISNNVSPEIKNITFDYMFEKNDIKNAQHKEAERLKILTQCDIVLSTLSSSTNECLFLTKMNFDLIIIDEACQSVELSTILPLKHAHKKMILIGDPMQLPPTIISSSELYSVSLYQRLLNFLPIYMLGIQYRMSSLIAEFPNICFYGGKLETDESCRNRPRPFTSTFPTIAFVEIFGNEVRNKTNGFSNQKEVFAVIKFIYTLYETKTFSFANNIAIITPYKTQAHLILATLKKMVSERKIDRDVLKHIEINTVDAFQGQEKDLVIISTVRSKNIGFINDASRMNVMLTRAKFSVVIFGNARFLCKDKLWKDLLDFYDKNNAVISENGFMKLLENMGKQ